MVRGGDRFLNVLGSKTDMTILPVKHPLVGAKRRQGGSEARAGLTTVSPTLGASGKSDFGVSLGIDAKYKHTAQKVDPETGEILGIPDLMAGRIQRFILQSVVRKLLPKSRTNNCLRVRASHKPVWSRDVIPQTIKVWQSKEHKTVFFSGLQTCGSVWQCPVCAAKIAERRRVEVLAAMTAWKAQGGCVNMLTLTCPHQRGDDLVVLLARQAKALNNFWKDRQVKAVLLEMGNIGQIKATETTNGRLSTYNNGWHPHYHVLMFSGSGVDLSRFDTSQMTDWQVRLYLRWANACKLAELGEPSYAHGLKLDNGEKAAQYVTKWGLEDEITKGHTKKAINGETPFDLLRALALDDTDRQAAALFIEFANAFKGKRQLHWSKGLKSRFAVQDKTDDELVQEKDDYAVALGAITIEQWRDVLAVEGRGAVALAAVHGGWPAVSSYLFLIKGKGVKNESRVLRRQETSHGGG